MQEKMQDHDDSLKISLIEEDSPKPQPQNKKKSKAASLLSLFHFATRFDFFLMVAGSLASLGAGLVFPFFVIFFGQITQVFLDQQRDQAEAKGLQVAIKFFIVGVAAWILSRFIFIVDFIGLYFWNLTGARQVFEYKKTYYRTILEQEVAWYDSVDTNQKATQIAGNIVAIETAISDKMSTILSVTVTTIFGFFYAFFNCWQLSLVLCSTLPLLVGSGFAMMKSMILNASKNKVAYQQAGGIAEQALGGIRTIKSLVGQDYQKNKFIKALQKSYGTSIKYTLYSSVAIGIVILVFLGIYSLGFWYGKTLIIEDPIKYNSATIIATFFCFVIGGSSIGQISPVMKNIADAKVAAGNLFQLINRKKSLVEPKKGINIKKLKSLKFQNVTFKYPKLSVQSEESQTAEVLKSVNIEFKKNKVTALVGQSGSGKSTIVQLLMRYYDPTSGEILVNGKQLSQLNLSRYRKLIGFVGQQPVLFAMSIEDNIKIANPQITDQQLKQAIKKANADQFIEKMNEGIKTYVGTGGTQLSGGQKQRIAIARAICSHPQILILDQATSALDRKNEREIQKTLKNLSEGNITSIVIAHRLSTVKNADEIIVMGKGQVLERGTHEQLIAKQGHYLHLVKTQMSAEQQDQQQTCDSQKQNTLVEKQAQESTQNLQKPEQKKKEQQAPKEEQDKIFRKLLKQSSQSFFIYLIGCIMALVRGAIFPFFNVALSNVMALLAVANIPENAAQIDRYCVIFAGIAVIGGFSTFAFQFSFGVIGQRLVFKLRKNIFEKLLRLPVAYYDKPMNTPGAISTKLAEDAFQIHNMTTGVIGVMFLNFATITTSLVIAFSHSWQLTLIVLGLSPILVVSNAIEMQRIKTFASKNQGSQKFIGSMISDTINNIRTVKSFGNINVFFEKYQSKLTELLVNNQKKVMQTAIFSAFSRGNIMVVEGIMFYIAAILFQNSVIIEPSAVYIAIFSVIFAAAGVGNNSAYMPDMAKSKIAGVRVFTILQSEDEQQISVAEGGNSIQDADGDIEFRNVTFKYPERDQLILDNFNLIIKKGQKVGLVGPSGSGKSTIIQLIQRFYPVSQGQIIVNGKSIKEYDLYSYRRQLGLVSQQPTLFQGTVKQNIEYSIPRTQQDIFRYCNISHATTFIKQWQQSLQKQVGQKGSQISGGQKQRIALARCLVRQPKIFLLDEWTSALDADSQKIVFQNLKPVLKNHTSISIAQRLSTIQDANRIVMMRNGKIIESGSYEDLINLKENFYRLAKGIQ